MVEKYYENVRYRGVGACGHRVTDERPKWFLEAELEFAEEAG